MIDDPADRPRGGLPPLSQGPGWVVVAKPPRLLVHRNPRMRHSDAALQRVRRQMGTRVYPIHRLDRNTSGCLLFAVDRKLAGPLSKAHTSPEATKVYVAFVRGYVALDGPTVVETPIKYPDGTYKDARSVVRVLGRSHEPRCSLLEVRPDTGRHHQVRRHVRDLHHPIIGDGDHGDSRVNRWWRENMGNARLGLHCVHLHVPASTYADLDHDIDATCPLFTDQFALFSQLPWWDDAVAALPALGRPPLTLLEDRVVDGGPGPSPDPAPAPADADPDAAPPPAP